MIELPVKNNRRDFLKKSITVAFAAVGASAAAGFLASCDKDEGSPVKPAVSADINISAYPELAAVGGIKQLILKDASNKDLNNGFPIIFRKAAEDVYTAIDSTCTHEGCQVDLPKTATPDRMICPCHASAFSVTTGSVLQGPNDGKTIQPLRTFKTAYNPTTKILTIQI